MAVLAPAVSAPASFTLSSLSVPELPFCRLRSPPQLSVVPKPVKNHMILCLGKVGCDGTLNLVKKVCMLGKVGLVSDPSEYLFAIYKSCDNPDSSLRKRLCGGHVCVQKYQWKSS